jgi:patatin-like phospholipase
VTYRILSFDGGGVWALIQVQALIQLYSPNTTGHQVLADFDLAAANSGGSIALGGLIEDLPLSTILGYFETEALRRSIFQPTGRFPLDVISGLAGFGPKYSAAEKLPALVKLMPQKGNLSVNAAVTGVRRQGSNADVHILITAFDFDRNLACFFRSAPAGGPGWGDGAASSVTVAEAIHASTNAPVNYFDAPASVGSSRYWDGAIAGCNNPVLAAVTEAIVLGNSPADIRALSIGTGTPRLPGPPAQHPSSPMMEATSPQGFPIDLAKLAGSVTDDPPDVATFLAHVMTGGPAGVPAPADSRIVRLNPMISPVQDAATNTWKPPGAWTSEQFEYLTTQIHLDALVQGDVDYISSLAGWWIADAVANQPMRMHADTLELELGYPTFSKAWTAWNAIK